MSELVIYKWTLEKCKEKASGFKSKTQWRVGHRASYEAAKKRGWIQICYLCMDYKGKYKGVKPEIIARHRVYMDEKV